MLRRITMTVIRVKTFLLVLQCNSVVRKKGDDENVIYVIGA